MPSPRRRTNPGRGALIRDVEGLAGPHRVILTDLMSRVFGPDLWHSLWRAQEGSRAGADLATAVLAARAASTIAASCARTLIDQGCTVRPLYRATLARTSQGGFEGFSHVARIADLEITLRVGAPSNSTSGMVVSECTEAAEFRRSVERPREIVP